jgi:choline-sulfatase
MTRPNIVWIYCDELRNDALGCYGNDHAEMQTPHIDGLAKGGVRFDACFCNSPVCVPSRASTLTALHPEDMGVYHNEAFWPNFVLPDPPVTFPEILAGHGYQSASFGKTHIPRALKPWPWDVERMKGSLHRDYLDGLDLEAVGAIRPPGGGLVLGGTFPSDRPYPGDMVTGNALAWMRQAREPYLVRIAYLQPHTPVLPPPPFATLYEKASFPDQIEAPPESVSRFEKRFAEVFGGPDMTPEQRFKAQMYYYGLVAWIDSQVGRVTQALKDMGQDKRTLVVFGSDHGTSLGEAGMYQKQTFAYPVHRVPFLMRWPGVLAQGQARTDLCEGLDLARTLLSLAGVEPEPAFKGRDVFSSAPPEAVFSTIGYGFRNSRAFPNLRAGRYLDGHGWPRRACIRTDRFRLDLNARLDGGPVALEDEDVFLADRNSDPAERFNLADDPNYQDVRARLSERLKAHLAGAVEPPEAYVLLEGAGQQTRKGTEA